MLNFSAIGWYKVSDGLVTSVFLDRDCDDFDWLKGQRISLDGVDCRVAAVEFFAHSPPWRKGERIGLLVRSDGT